MKNFEYWKKEIKELVAEGVDIAVSKGKPCDCNKCYCIDCDFSRVIDEEDYDYGCYGDNDRAILEWLYEEHIEPPKISARTKKFFEAIETGWVARDYDGGLFIFEIKPYKDHADFQWDVHCDVCGDCDTNYDMRTLNDYPFSFLTLDFIKWEDEEPWSVEDILKLEVDDRT